MHPKTQTAQNLLFAMLANHQLVSDPDESDIDQLIDIAFYAADKIFDKDALLQNPVAQPAPAQEPKQKPDPQTIPPPPSPEPAIDDAVAGETLETSELPPDTESPEPDMNLSLLRTEAQQEYYEKMIDSLATLQNSYLKKIKLGEPLEVEEEFEKELVGKLLAARNDNLIFSDDLADLRKKFTTMKNLIDDRLSQHHSLPENQSITE